MSKLYYCVDCKRVIKNEVNCDYCGSGQVKELAVGAPVNIAGSKMKAHVLKVSGDKVRVLVKDDANQRYIKEYLPEQLRKVL